MLEILRSLACGQGYRRVEELAATSRYGGLLRAPQKTEFLRGRSLSLVAGFAIGFGAALLPSVPGRLVAQSASSDRVQLAGNSSATHTPRFNWQDAKLEGPYPLAPGLRTMRVDGPNGKTPSYQDLESLRYHHHTRVAVDRTGRIWIAYSGALRQEGESGMITELKSSRDGKTWTQPRVVIAPASQFDGDQRAGRRISYPRAFVTYQDRLYLIAAIDQANGVGCCTNEQGEALVAVALHPDGSIGKPFRVSAQPYMPFPGFPDYAFDPVRGPALFHHADVFGTWGGSAPGQPASAWVGYGVASDGTLLVEPNTIRLLHPAGKLLRLWRDEGKTQQFVLYAATSHDDGRTWSPAAPINVPNSPSETTLIQLSNGQIALVGNARDLPSATDARDPLYLAIFDGRSGVLEHVYAVRQGLGAAKYPEHQMCGPLGKPCGAGYPGAFEHAGKLYISYSVDKQTVWLAVVPLMGL